MILCIRREFLGNCCLVQKNGEGGLPYSFRTTVSRIALKSAKASNKMSGERTRFPARRGIAVRFRNVSVATRLNGEPNRAVSTEVSVATRLSGEPNRVISTEVSVATRLCRELEFTISDQKSKRVAIRTSVEPRAPLRVAGA